jgi:acyl-CoA dehydrogenase
LHDFLRNFPNRFLGGVLRILIFPGGRSYFAPSDRLGRQLAEAILNPTEVRDRLCRFVYRTLEPGNPLGLLQEALVMAQTAEPIEKRIRVEGVKTGKVTARDVTGQISQALAAGIISETEAASLREYDRKVMELISVDDFDSSEMAAGVEPADARDESDDYAGRVA